MQISALLKLLADTTRLRCLVLLHRHGELCVCDLTGTLQLPQPKISHHLGLLRKAGLVSDRKQGLWIHYRINPALDDDQQALLARTVNMAVRQSPFAEDLQQLACMSRQTTCG